MGLFKALFQKPIVQIMFQYLSLTDIVMLSSTCRLLKWKWIDSMAAPLKMKDRVRSMFGWKFDCMKQFNANVVAALTHDYPCMGGCGNMTARKNIVDRGLCKYVYCRFCFDKINVKEYMDKRGFILVEVAISRHFSELSKMLHTFLSDDLIDEIMKQYYSRTQLYMKFYFHRRVRARHSEYIKRSIADRQVERHLHEQDIKGEVKEFLKVSIVNAQMRERNAENDLKNAKELVISRKRTLEQL